MPRTRSPYPEEFRRKMVELVRSGRSPHKLSREFEPTAVTISSWVKRAHLDEGRRADGLTTDARDELARLRRENTCACGTVQASNSGLRVSVDVKALEQQYDSLVRSGLLI